MSTYSRLFTTFLMFLLFSLQSSAFAMSKSSSKHSQKQWHLQQLADQAAQKYGLNTHLFRALVKHESTWRPRVVSSRGAVGLTQLLPATAKATCGLSARDLYEPEKNLDCGAKYLTQQIQRFGSVKLGLCAYNAGPPIVKRLGRCPRIRVTQKYVRKITGEWRKGVWGPLLTQLTP